MSVAAILTEEKVPKMEVLQLLNRMKETTQSSHSIREGQHDLCYVETFFGAKKVQAMVDFDTSHNYVLADKARSLGLRVDPFDTCFKAVSSLARKIEGDVKNVIMQVGSWQGLVNLVAIKMIEYDLRLGQEFIHWANDVIALHLGCVMVLDPTRPCMVPTVQARELSKRVSVLGLKKIVRK